ncbi:hypothetical protein HYDPIDRAFT_25208 [Hydnomerulius pinastri MD-312]|nr:hypothetical protein HYDPIDRAFT_25208 [Hydnomerulius pinastri MD-312]
MDERLDVLSSQSLNASMPPRSQQPHAESSYSRQQQYRGGAGETEYTQGDDQYGQTPRTQTADINTQVTGTMAESIYQSDETETVDDECTTGEDGIQRLGTVVDTDV